MKNVILKFIIMLSGSGMMISCNPTNRLITKNQEKMFTAEQIKAAHSKVKSGADFPAYIRDIKRMGVTRYETFVTDGNSNYYGANSYHVSSGPKYNILVISETPNKEQFQKDLKAHQNGETDFPTFRDDCARLGIEKWITDIEKMTCTYYDKAGNMIVVEQIPQ